MRIAIVTTEYASVSKHYGGAGTYMRRISLLLSGAGHEVHVVTPADADGVWDADGVTIHAVRHGGRICGALHRLTLGRCRVACYWLAFSIRAWWRLRRLHREQGLDFLYLMNLHGNGLAPLAMLDLPHAVRVSSFALDPYWIATRKPSFDQRVMAHMECLQLRLADHVFFPSTWLRGLVESCVKLKRSHALLTPFDQDVAILDRTVLDRTVGRKRFILYFSGALTLHKGPHILGAALRTVLPLVRDMRVVVVGKDRPFGEGSMRNHIRDLCGEECDRLVFLDPLPHEQLYPLIEAAEVVVLPSLTENLPNAGLETLGLGGVLIGTRDTGFSEIIQDGQNGFLCGRSDPDDLGKVLRKVLGMPDTTAVRAAARASVQRFAPDLAIEELLGLMESIREKHTA